MLAQDIRRLFRNGIITLSSARVHVNEAAEYKVSDARMTTGEFGERCVCGDSTAVSYDVHWFLKRLTFPTRVAILFKGWQPRQVAAIVVDICYVYWDTSDYPRVDFLNPPAIVEKFLGGGGFWGGFILAVAKVPPDMEIMGQEDPTLQIFSELVKTWAIV